MTDINENHGHWTRGRDGNWYGIAAEKDLCPIVPGEQAGTAAICTDTREVALFNSALQEWHWKR